MTDVTGFGAKTINIFGVQKPYYNFRLLSITNYVVLKCGEFIFRNESFRRKRFLQKLFGIIADGKFVCRKKNRKNVLDSFDEGEET